MSVDEKEREREKVSYFMCAIRSAGAAQSTATDQHWRPIDGGVLKEKRSTVATSSSLVCPSFIFSCLCFLPVESEELPPLSISFWCFIIDRYIHTDRQRVKRRLKRPRRQIPSNKPRHQWLKEGLTSRRMDFFFAPTFLFSPPSLFDCGKLKSNLYSLASLSLS